MRNRRPYGHLDTHKAILKTEVNYTSFTICYYCYTFIFECCNHFYSLVSFLWLIYGTLIIWCLDWVYNSDVNHYRLEIIFADMNNCEYLNRWRKTILYFITSYHWFNIPINVLWGFNKKYLDIPTTQFEIGLLVFFNAGNIVIPFNWGIFSI